MAPNSKNTKVSGHKILTLFAFLTCLSFLHFVPNEVGYKNSTGGRIFAGSTHEDKMHQVKAPAMERNVLSYSLYGQDPRYIDGALANSELYKDMFPGWSLRVYHDDSVPQDILEKLRKQDADLIDMSGSDLNPMTWRFLASSDPTVARMCSRDLDSRLSFREFHAVDEWAHSTFKVHVIRDHPSHMEIRCKMPGGMWCAQERVLKDMSRMIDSYSKNTGYDMDQQFLAKIVWPKVRHVTMQHVSFGCDEHVNTRPMLPRAGLNHIGAVFLDGKMRTSDTDILQEAITHGAECTPHF